MGLIWTIMPLLIIGGIWYLIVKGGRRLRNKGSTARSIDAQPRPAAPIPASSREFGTRATPVRPAALPLSPHVLGPESHERGAPEDQPFGEDIVTPDSRTIPAQFLGTWIYPRGGNPVIFEADRYQYMDVLGMQPVVAVRRISETEIAIVSQQVENGTWLYCLQLYGLLDGGKELTDLENMDMKWVRA